MQSVMTRLAILLQALAVGHLALCVATQLFVCRTMEIAKKPGPKLAPEHPFEQCTCSCTAVGVQLSTHCTIYTSIQWCS